MNDNDYYKISYCTDLDILRPMGHIWPIGCLCLAHLRSGKLEHKSKHRPPFMQYGCVAFILKRLHFCLCSEALAIVETNQKYTI